MPLTTVQVGSGWFAEDQSGLNRYFHDLVEALPEVGVVCRGLVVGTARVDEETDGTVRVFAGPGEPVARRRKAARVAVARIWAALSVTEPKVLVTHFASYAYPLLKDGGDRPWVVHFHGPWAEDPQAAGGGMIAAWINKRIERKVYQGVDHLIVLSTAYRDLLVQEYGVNAANISVIPGGVDCARFSGAAATSRVDARAQFGWPKDRPVVLCVRKLAAGMGLTLLVDAIGIVRRTVPNVRCVIAGRGPLAEPLVKRMEAAGLSDAVTLLGFVPDEDLPLAYRAADLSVVPSETSEGFGLSAVESLAAGTPAVVTPMAGLPDIVRGLSPKLIAVDATPGGLAAALAAGLADPSTLPSVDACRSYAAATFDWPVIARRIAAVYADTASKRRH